MICIPITDKTEREAILTLERSAAAADAVELRMDLIENGRLEKLMAAARRASGRVKIIVTCRRKEEATLVAGDHHCLTRKKEISKATKMTLFRQAVLLKADFIDMELAHGENEIRKLRAFCRKQKSETQIIVSWHDLDKTPSLKRLKEIFQASVDAGADIVKIVPLARCMEDNLKILSLITYARQQGRKIIAMCMGEQGQISRMMAPLWGSYLCFAVLPGGKKSAPGQLTVRTMREFRHLLHDNRCAVQPWLLPPGSPNFVLLGNPVHHSLSPLMHNKALEAMGINGHYSAFCVTDLARAISGIRGMNIRGASVTIPFKTDVMQYLDEIDPDAAALGAVNTIVNQRGRLAGYNTDWSGLMQAIREKISIAGNRFVILGAGGAARAAVYGIQKEGGHPVVVNRTPEKGRALAELLDCPFHPFTELDRLSAPVLINTTSVGLYPQVNRSPVPAGMLANYALVVDVIYNPLKTKLLQDAEAQGCKIISGLEMFVRQGAGQLKLWTGREAPLTLMKKTVRERLETLEN